MADTRRTESLARSGEPAYLQIADQLRNKIHRGELPADTVLPSTARLGATYGVSASVVKAAISVLRSEGLVIGQQGKGVFVRPEGRSSTPATPTGDEELDSQLSEIRQTLRVLSDRMAKIEAAVFPGRS